LTQVVQKRRIVWLQGQGRLEAFPCGGVLATLKEVNAVLVIFAEPLLGCGFAPSQAQGQRQQPTQPPHTALPLPPTIGRCPKKEKRNVRQLPLGPFLLLSPFSTSRLRRSGRSGDALLGSLQELLEFFALAQQLQVII